MNFLNIIFRPIKWGLIAIIRAYQVLLSPLLGQNKCRYNPTCSHYMIHAIEEWGILRGGFMGIKRIMRCHPWATHPTYDPVKKKEKEKSA